MCQIQSVDKSLLSERVSSLPQRIVHELNRGLALVLGLGERRG